jgi:hypothetical protein
MNDSKPKWSQDDPFKKQSNTSLRRDRMKARRGDDMATKNNNLASSSRS